MWLLGHFAGKPHGMKGLRIAAEGESLFTIMESLSIHVATVPVATVLSMQPQSRVVYVLTYHSQNVTGSRYEQSDRIAFGIDLDLFKELGFEVVSALRLARALRHRAFATLPQRCVVLTMDDGPLVDFAESDIPPHVGQESMLSALRRQHKTILGFPIGKPPAVATSFVIASPSAREQLSAPVKMPWFNDTWWLAAQQSGYLDVGTHSWNHVHPDVDELAGTPHLKAAFHKLDTVEEADRQILQASRSVRAITKHPAAGLFAYPYGQTNEFLVREYLPRQDAVIAAFTTEPEPVHEGTGIWEIPRYICGDHWKSRDQLTALLMGLQ